MLLSQPIAILENLGDSCKNRFPNFLCPTRVANLPFKNDNHKDKILSLYYPALTPMWLAHNTDKIVELLKVVKTNRPLNGKPFFGFFQFLSNSAIRVLKAKKMEVPDHIKFVKPFGQN